MSASRSSSQLLETSRSHKHYLWRAIQVFVALGLLGVVLSMVEWHRFLQLASRASPGWLVLVFLLGLADRVLMAGKWLYLLRGLGIELRLTRALAHYFQGGLVGAATQWQLGGDITRAVRAGHETGRSGAVAASIVLEKLAGLAALGALAVLSVFLLNRALSFLSWPLAWAVTLVGVPSFLALPFLLTRPASLKLINRLTKLVPHERFRTFVALPSLGEYNRRLPAILGVFLALTLCEQLVPVLVVYMLALSFGFDLTLLQTLSTVPIVVFLMRLPISVVSVGVPEGLLLLFLGLVGLDATQSFLIAFSARGLDLLVVSVAAGATLLLPRGHGARREAIGEVETPEEVTVS